MVLYSANISKLAKPVKSVSRKKVKEIELEPTHEEEELVPPKKKMSAKQLENLAKGQAALAAKRAAEVDAVKPKVKKQKVAKEVEVEKVPEVKKKVVRKKKEVEPEVQEVEEKPKPKRIRVKKLKEPEPESEELEVEEPPKKRAKKVKDDSAPPAWFNQYVATVKREEASLKPEKISAKQMKEDVKEVANQKWNDGLTRDRVTNEVDNHMSRMYSQIFARN